MVALSVRQGVVEGDPRLGDIVSVQRDGNRVNLAVMNPGAEEQFGKGHTFAAASYLANHTNNSHWYSCGDSRSRHHGLDPFLAGKG